MRIIEEVKFSENQFLSNVFTVPKKDGEYRMILNLKDLNEKIVYHHFKMDTFEIALKLIKPSSYMASIDIRHAYYSVPIAVEHRKFLRFQWKDKIFQYTCLPNGIACAPRYFTKLLKPIYATLRKLGHINAGYIDDSLLIGDDKAECKRNVTDTQDLFEKVGFIVHQKKSIFEPVQKLQFLGFLIDSIKMIVTLPEEKIKKVSEACLQLLKKSNASIQELASVIGLIVSTFSAVQYGKLHYRCLELQKINALKNCAGDYNGKTDITSDMKQELNWWVDNIENQFRNIDQGTPNFIITTDASLEGWGAVCDKVRIGGRWTFPENFLHINCLELLAAFNAIKSFCKHKANLHVGLKIDNTCAISYINNMGGIKSHDCNRISREMWEWCIERNIWLTADYVPSSQNIADVESRHFNDNVEWMLCKNIFNSITKMWGTPEIDMFASRLNKQISKFVSWKPDPDSQFVNAFSVSWTDMYFYAFPPFSVLGRCIQKIHRDKAECILIAPIWPTQSWYTILLQLLIDHPVILPLKDNLLTIPQSEKVHPLHKKLRLMACRLSGNVIQTRNFLQKQPASSLSLGDLGHKDSTLVTLKSGLYSVVKGKLIHFVAL